MYLITSSLDWFLVSSMSSYLIFKHLFCLFVFIVNSLIPLAPQFNAVYALWSVQSKKENKKFGVGGRGREMGGNVSKTLEDRILLPSIPTLSSPIVA